MGGLAPIVTSAIGLGAPVAGATLTPLIARGVMNYVSGSRENSQLRDQQGLALQQLQAQQRMQQQQIAADTALEKEKLAMQARADEDTRRAALRRAVARQRAQFGASGIGNAGDGSGEAVLLGMFSETESDLNNRAQLDGLRSRALDMNATNRASLNILQRTQLQERQKFERNLNSFF